MKRKLWAAIITAAVIALLPLPDAMAGSGTSIRGLTPMEMISEMGLGINLGNTFEACGDWIRQWGDGTPNAYETAWGSPTVTEEMIRGYASEGFKTLRVPVAWSNMMAQDGTWIIHPDYLSRVRQVVGWALDAGLYVILNLHWDGGWLEDLPSDHDRVMGKYTAIWQQVSAAFRDDGDKLVFEAQNEELGWNTVWNQWSGQGNKQLSYSLCNEVNQTFVNVVRESGGNNASRLLLVSGYNTDIGLTCDPLFRMPEDPAGCLALSLHYYTPSTFAILEEDADWGKCAASWGTDAEYAELSRNFGRIETCFVSKGIPVILGEFGCPVKNKDPESVRRFLSAVAGEAFRRGGICPVLWDTPGGRYDRGLCRFTDRTLLESMLPEAAAP